MVHIDELSRAALPAGDPSDGAKRIARIGRGGAGSKGIRNGDSLYQAVAA